MARLNDNLFTTLLDCTKSHGVGFFSLPRIRLVRVQHMKKALSEQAFKALTNIVAW